MNLQLKQIRQAKGYSQEDMSLKLSELMEREVKVSRYGTWERGDRMMNLEQAYYCAVALNCTLNDLVGMETARSYADSRQGRINEQYEDMNERGRQRAADSVDDAHSNPRNLKSAQGLGAEGRPLRKAAV